MMAVISFCALGLVVGSKPILEKLTAPSFHGAAVLVPLIVAAYYMRCIGDFFRCLFFAANKPSWEAICNGVGALVCVAGYLLLIPRYGMWGAAIATAITFLVISVISVVYSYRLYHYRLETVRLMKLVGTMSVLCGLYYLVPVSAWPLQVGWAILLVSAYPLLLIALKCPTSGEREHVRALVSRYLLRRPAAVS
jgi:O-antigen/teichoic acid export membrane protein